MTTYTGQTTLSSVAIVESKAILNPHVAQGNLSSFGSLTGRFGQDGETNSIGLVIFGNVEFAGSRSTIPSGINRTYGYWRGSDDKPLLNKFNQLWVPLEGTGNGGGGKRRPEIMTVSPSASASTSASGSDDSTCSAGTTDYEWTEDPYSGGEWILTGVNCPDPSCTQGAAPSRDGYYNGEIYYSPCSGSSESDEYGTSTFDTLIKGPSGVGTNIGSAEWERAGELIDQIGKEAIKERCLKLSGRAYYGLGSGANVSGGGYSAYAKILPSGDVSNSVILSQHREDPALFVMGCDNDGSYYIRSDKKVGDDFTPVYARSEKRFDEYKYPAQVIGVFASGDSKLKIYVNGSKEGESEVFTRSVERSANTQIILGKSESPISEGNFQGWIEELGVSSDSFEEEEIKNFHDSTFKITDYVFNTEAEPTGIRGFSGTEFGDKGIAAKNTSYVEFLVASGAMNRYNPWFTTPAPYGGVFDADLWKQGNFGVSSVLNFDLNNLPNRLHQITDVSVDMWVENNTSNRDGVNISARLIHKDIKSTTNRENLNWYSHKVNLPSGIPKLISLTGVMPNETKRRIRNVFKDGDLPIKDYINDHELELVVHYPPQTHPFDASLRIYSTKMNFEGFDSLAKYNTKDGLIETNIAKGHSTFDIDGNFVSFASGDKSLTLYSAGTSAVATTGTMNLFVNTTTADQALNLVINQDPVTDMGNTATGSLSANAAIAMSGRTMNLFTKAGSISSDLVLFLKQDEPIFAASPTIPLNVAGSILSFPRAENNTSLFTFSFVDQGSQSGILNLAMPNVGNGSVNADQILFVEGKKPIAQIPLYLETNKSITHSIPLFVLAPPVYSPSGTLNMFIKQKDFYGNSLINAIPTILGTGNIPLSVTGHSYPSGILEFAMPEVFGSGTNTTTLNIKGYN